MEAQGTIERLAFKLFCKASAVDPKFQHSVWFESTPFGIPDEDDDLGDTAAIYVVDRGKNYFRGLAMAALKAIRIPSKAMLQAVEKIEDERYVGYERMPAEEAWPVMIDATLNEQEKG